MTSTPDRILFGQHLDDMRAYRHKRAYELSLWIDRMLKAELVRRIQLDGAAPQDTRAHTQTDGQSLATVIPQAVPL